MKEHKSIILPIIALTAAVVGVLLMAVSGPGEEKSTAAAEERFRSAILSIEGVTEAQVIITHADTGETKGVAVVCSADRDVREEVTRLVGSGLGLSSNRIHVVCN